MPKIDAELRKMRDKLNERRKRLVRRDAPADGAPPTAPDRIKTVVAQNTPRRPKPNEAPPLTRASAARGDGPSATVAPSRSDARRPDASPAKASRVEPPLGNIKVPPTERLKTVVPPPSSASAPAKKNGAPPRAAPAPEARWLEAAHRAWKSQVAELLRDKADGEQNQRRLEAELAAALRAWKSQVAELLQRVEDADRKATERERWLEAAHQAWKSQTAELLARAKDTEAKPRSSAIAQDRRLTEELATLRRQMYEEQLRHVDELEGVHSAYLQRAQEVDAAHFRVVDELRHEKERAFARLGDALRLADRLNHRLQQMEAIRSPAPGVDQKKEAKHAAPSPASPAKRKGFLDRAEAATTVVGAPPTKPPRS